MRRQETAARLRNQRVVAVERMLVGRVVPVLQPRQQPADSWNLVVERLRELEQRLAQTAARALAVAEPFEAAGELDIVVEVVHPVAGEALPIGRSIELTYAGQHIAVRIGKRADRDR